MPRNSFEEACESLISSFNSNSLRSSVQTRYVAVSLVIIIYCFLNTFLVFKSGWYLAMLNFFNLLGAISLFSEHYEDIKFNERGIKLYLLGCFKVFIIFALYSYATFVNLIGSPSNQTDSEEDGSKFYQQLRLLSGVVAIFDLIYILMGYWILKETRKIIEILKPRRHELPNINFCQRPNYMNIELKIVRQ